MQYPEVGRLGPASYCNPYFGFRLALPAGLTLEPIHLPVQPHGKHLLLALRFMRLDRSAELFVASGSDELPDAARVAARTRMQQARDAGMNSSGVGVVKLGGNELFTVHVVNNYMVSVSTLGNESSYYLLRRGQVIHFAVLSNEPDLVSQIGKAIERIGLAEPGDDACRPAQPSSMAGLVELAEHYDDAPYFGPALPTDLVESRLREPLAPTVPAGRTEGQSFTDAALGLHLTLPSKWQALSADDAAQVKEIMRDPLNDPDSADRRRALFRSCARALFAAEEPERELMPGVHSSVAIVAMPIGCVPDLTPPESMDNRMASEEFATLLLRSAGTPLLSRGSIHNAAGHLVFQLDGSLPYQLEGEKLSRRMSLRLTAVRSKSWLLLIYSVTQTPAEQRELESQIAVESSSSPTSFSSLR